VTTGHQRATTWYAWMVFALLLISCLLIAAGICVGSTGFEPINTFLSNPASHDILWHIRLPRSIGAYLAGALLGMTGAIAQGLFRNPLADPYLLGSASGASLGVACALMVFGGSPFAEYWLARLGLTGAAFVGAVSAVLLTLLLARGAQDRLKLLLSGVIVSVIFSAVTSVIAFRSPAILQALQSFLLGSTSFMSWASCVVMGGVLLVGLIASAALARMLDALILGERTAMSLGVYQPVVGGVLILIMSLTTGAAVAHAGLIAFVGLVAPHLGRSFVKANHAKLIGLSTLIGGVLLLAADLLARGLLAPEELPVGILTALLGGGYLCWLMYRQPSTRQTR